MPSCPIAKEGLVQYFQDQDTDAPLLPVVHCLGVSQMDEINHKTRLLFKKYASAVAYIEVETPSGERSIGSAFHVGEGVFITARHVVDQNRILNVGTTTTWYPPDPKGLITFNGIAGKFTSILPGEGRLSAGPYFHPDSTIDVAAIVVEGLEPPTVPLGSHLDDWINDDEFILATVVVMGYPPIPFSKEPLLVTARGEINAVVDKYVGRHPHFVISTMPRGGFSGGLCIIEWDFALGVVTESLVRDNKTEELGFMAVLSVEPIWVCLEHHKLIPTEQKEGWDGAWD